MSRRSSTAEPAARRSVSSLRGGTPAADAPKRRSWRQLLKHHVRLQRIGFDFRFVLVDPSDAAPSKKAKAAAPPAPKSRASQGLDAGRLALMRTELRMLMKRHPQARALARHLAYFERALHKSGARAYDEVPVEVLRKALIQIEFLVSNWSALGLAELRSRLSIAIGDREAELHGPESVQDLRALKGHAVSVQDATVSQFMEMQRSWLQPAPGGVPLTPREDKTGAAS
ncbi:hypothetical protein [Caldimonas sp. KR1-144]|uniref:hypothetical protein n=1 Tax=Caldimonas sp. KR1-144 TaxID=3400911 RepID=UPI003BFBF245